MFIWEVIADHPAQGRKQGDREGKQDRKVCVLLQTEPEHASSPPPRGRVLLLFVGWMLESASGRPSEAS